MAAPITHIALTDKIYERYFSEMKKDEFYVGTSFPDIRYMGVIERNATHYKEISLKDVLKEDSFNAGVKFHSLVDIVRERFVRKKNYYSFFPKSKFIAHAAKIQEDMILYDKVKNWPEIIIYFDKIYQEELSYGIERKDIEKWHQTRQLYFAKKPIGKNTIISSITSLGIQKEYAEEVHRVIEGSNKEKVKEIILGFYNNFEKLI